MAREIESITNAPVVQIATIIPIMLTVGANRIVPGVAIPHPVGDPGLGSERDRVIREELVMRSLRAMLTEISEQTIFGKE